MTSAEKTRTSRESACKSWTSSLKDVSESSHDLPKTTWNQVLSMVLTEGKARDLLPDLKK